MYKMFGNILVSASIGIASMVGCADAGPKTDPVGEAVLDEDVEMTAAGTCPRKWKCCEPNPDGTCHLCAPPNNPCP